jgi:hypothetical protein
MLLRHFPRKVGTCTGPVRRGAAFPVSRPSTVLLLRHLIPDAQSTRRARTPLGLVGNLNRPGGNITGMAGFTTAPGAKRLGLLHELVPTAAAIAVLVNPNNAGAETDAKDASAAAQTLGLKLHVLNATCTPNPVSRNFGFFFAFDSP